MNLECIKRLIGVWNTGVVYKWPAWTLRSFELGCELRVSRATRAGRHGV